MNRILKLSFFLVGLLICAVGCRKKSWDNFYGVPDDLAEPIYTVLKEKGNFTHLLAAMEKAGYDSTLNAAGYWTLFAPDDEAFEAYFAEKGITGVSAMTEEQCRKIVTYCLVYYAYKKERLGDYQSTTGWLSNMAFRRRTANYTGVYTDVDKDGASKLTIASNRNNNGTTYYVDKDNNYKYLTYFVDQFFTAAGLSATDYNYFFPNTTYTGFNVLDATVTEQDINAGNGVIHVIDKVIEALPSIDDYLRENSQYSLFYSLYLKYMVSYVANATVTKTYQTRNGGSDQVYTKVYNSLLAYSLGNENFLSPGTNDAQQGCYTIFAPTNDVLQAYIDTVLLEHYSSLDDMDPAIIAAFLNAHMWQTPVWPSQFATTYNYVGEDARFDPESNVTEKKILSNGMLYGTNKVQDANVFASVYGKAYLDPDYSMMLSLLNMELKSSISNIYTDYTVFMISNQMFNDAGFTVDATVSNDADDQWRFTPPAGSTASASTGSTARARLLRILNLHVIPNKVLDDLSGSGVAMSYGGEYVRYENNTVYTAGNVDKSEVANVLSYKGAKNGRVYYIDKILEFSEQTVGQDLQVLGASTTSEFNYFWQYLSNSSDLWTSSTKAITGVSSGTFYTVLVPNNAAILDAVNDGILPGTGTAPNMVPNFTPTTELEKAQVVRFVQYHILDKVTIGTDGEVSGSYPTVLTDNLGDATRIFVTNSVGSIDFTDMNSRHAATILSSSNYLSNRAVIHLLDNYLQYVY
ncbi:MAG: fasciclin domain-containing protein [Edaphocola sp.]